MLTIAAVLIHTLPSLEASPRASLLVRLEAGALPNWPSSVE